MCDLVKATSSWQIFKLNCLQLFLPQTSSFVGLIYLTQDISLCRLLSVLHVDVYVFSCVSMEHHALTPNLHCVPNLSHLTPVSLSNSSSSLSVVAAAVCCLASLRLPVLPSSGRRFSIMCNDSVLSAGFQIDTPDSLGRTCLHAAAAGGWATAFIIGHFFKRKKA